MNTVRTLMVVWLCACAPLALAHGRWIVPSHTILSGDKPEFVTFDISISNDIFHPDHAVGGVVPGEPKKRVPDNPRGKIMHELMSSSRVGVELPGGATDTSLPLVNMHRKSVSFYQLVESGTYRIQLIQNPVYLTFYENAAGERAREFGKPQMVTTFLPEGSKNVSGIKLNNRMATYVTRNQLTTETLAPSKEGLDVVFSGHPNELFAGEITPLTFYLHGKPAGDTVGVRLTRNDTRFRNAREAIELTSDASGSVKVEWPRAGMYLLEAEVEQNSKEPMITKEVFALYLTLEVNPE